MELKLHLLVTKLTTAVPYSIPVSQAESGLVFYVANCFAVVLVVESDTFLQHLRMGLLLMIHCLQCLARCRKKDRHRRSAQANYWLNHL